jgi:AcrR family transcriptional regulator
LQVLSPNNEKPTRNWSGTSQVTRDSLLTAAIALFAERGYDAIGTREIKPQQV